MLVAGSHVKLVRSVTLQEIDIRVYVPLLGVVVSLL